MIVPAYIKYSELALATILRSELVLCLIWSWSGVIPIERILIL